MSNKKTSETMSRFMRFVKKHGYYILLGAIAILITTIITLSVVLTSPKDSDQTLNGGQSGDDNPPNGNPGDGGDLGDDIKPEELKFYAPTAGEKTILAGKRIGDLNVKCYGVMFSAKKGDKVFAAGDGKVLLNGKLNDKSVLSVAYKDHGYVVDYYGMDMSDTTTSALKDGTIVSKNSIIGSSTGRYNYGGTFYESVHIDMFKLSSDGTKGDRITNFDTLEFESGVK